MSEPWDNHQAAVSGAIEKIGELQESLARATDQAETAIGAVLESIGSTEVASARNAMDFLSGVKERVDEAYGMSRNAVAELERYRGGF